MAQAPLNIRVYESQRGHWFVEFPLGGSTGLLHCKSKKAAHLLAEAMQKYVK